MVHKATSFLPVSTALLFATFGVITGLRPEEMTDVLDHLLDRYDKNIRPNLGKGPLEIETLLEVRSMGPLNEKDMVYSLQIYFRQLWYDERLRFDLPNTTELTLSQRFLPKIWRPTTFFHNGIQATQNIITVPNFFVRIRNDGRIYLSKRLSITARCPMNLVKYPMDKPSCPLIIGGYGVTTDEMTYKWRNGNDNSVTKSVTVLMAQFELNDMKAWNGTMQTPLGKASILTAYFYFHRYIGYYALNIYLPSYLTVALSWVSFWINRDATPARVLLGVTTLLSVTTIGMTVRFGLPGVPYATALDLFFILCFIYVFASLIEYAAVHFFTVPPISRKDSMDKGFEDENEGSDQEEVEEVMANQEEEEGGDYLDLDNNDVRYSCTKSIWYCVSGNMKYDKKRESCFTGCSNSISAIDVSSRKIFPLSFFGINLLYWIIYLDGRIGNEKVEFKLD